MTKVSCCDETRVLESMHMYNNRIKTSLTRNVGISNFGKYEYLSPYTRICVKKALMKTNKQKI